MVAFPHYWTDQSGQASLVGQNYSIGAVCTRAAERWSRLRTFHGIAAALLIDLYARAFELFDFRCRE